MLWNQIRCKLLVIYGYPDSTHYHEYLQHYSDVMMSPVATQIFGVSIVYLTIGSGADKKTPKLHVTGLCWGIHRWTVNSSHKGPVTRKMFPFDGVILEHQCRVAFKLRQWKVHFKYCIHQNKHCSCQNDLIHVRYSGFAMQKLYFLTWQIHI